MGGCLWNKQREAPRGYRSLHCWAPQDPPAAQLEAALLDQYVGTYKVGADLVYTISRQGDHLTGAVNGGPPVMLEAELPDVLFTPGRPRIRRIFKRDDSGRVTGYVSRREGRDVMFTKSS